MINSKFVEERNARVVGYGNDSTLLDASSKFMLETIRSQYSYNFEWLSRPIIQYPQDILAMQELIWQIKPDLIIETGVAHGGSLIFSASMLALLDYSEAVESGQTLTPQATKRRVLGIDIDIRPHNRLAIEAHPMSHRIDLLEGSSIASDMVTKVYDIARGYDRILVCLDSNHTHEHVLAELESYAPLTTQGSYCCVFDTIVEDLPNDASFGRPWQKGNNPKTAVQKYMENIRSEGRSAIDGSSLRFEADESIDRKLLISVAPGGYLKRV